MSALQAVRVRENARHVLFLEGRHGADDEDTGSDFAGDGEEDHVWQAAEILSARLRPWRNAPTLWQDDRNCS